MAKDLEKYKNNHGKFKAVKVREDDNDGYEDVNENKTIYVKG